MSSEAFEHLFVSTVGPVGPSSLVADININVNGSRVAPRRSPNHGATKKSGAIDKIDGAAQNLIPTPAAARRRLGIDRSTHQNVNVLVNAPPIPHWMRENPTEPSGSMVTGTNLLLSPTLRRLTCMCQPIFGVSFR